MLNKAKLVFIFLLFFFPGLAQKSVVLTGPDNLKITIVNDSSVKKLLLLRQSLKENPGSPDSFSYPNSNADFYKKLKGFLKSDSLGKLVEDSVKRYLAGNNRIEIIIDTGHGFIPPDIDTTIYNPSTQGNGDLPSSSVNSTPIILYVIISLVVIAGLMFLLSRNKGKKKGSPDTEKKKVEKDQPEEKYNLPQSLVDKFGRSPKYKRDPEKIAQAILEQFKEMENTITGIAGKLEISEAAIENLKEKLAISEKDAGEKEIAIQGLNKKIADQLAEKQNTESKGKDFKRQAEEVISKYYTQLAIRLQGNDITDTKQIEGLLLKNIFTLAFQSASLLKKYCEDSSALDELNIKLLEGLQPAPTNVINENSQYDSSFPLAYYVFHLLNAHGVKGLEGVFIQGSKIGD